MRTAKIKIKRSRNLVFSDGYLQIGDLVNPMDRDENLAGGTEGTANRQRVQDCYDLKDMVAAYGALYRQAPLPAKVPRTP